MWTLVVQLAPLLAAMGVLIICSSFCSASEAAMFSLRPADRRFLAKGNRSQRLAAGLLSDPERLLTAVLFWNLTVNIVYFALASIASLKIEQHTTLGSWAAFGFAGAALLTIIFFSEMLPKSMAVIRPRLLAGIAGGPLAVAVRMLDPITPLLSGANMLSRRLICPRFETEAYLEISDLERAVELSTSDAQLVAQEQAALRNIVLLSDIRVDEWMRPRTQFRTFSPPVTLTDLHGEIPPSGYLLITEAESEEVALAIHLKELVDVPREHLEHYADPVVVIPWCATVADALQELRQRQRQVAAIVNEHGETIGILTLEDLLDTIFSYHPSRSRIILNRKPIHVIDDGVWLVAGVTSLRSLSRELGVTLPSSKAVTIGGVIQERLGRLAVDGDQCVWGSYHMQVLEAPERGHMLIKLRRTAPTSETTP